MDKIAEIRAALRSLTSSGVRESRLELADGPVYVLLTAHGGRRSVRCEAVASASLPPERKLGQEQAARLRRLGFAKSAARRNWTKEVDSADAALADLAGEVYAVLTEIYGVRPEDLRTRIVHDDTEHPENPALDAAMEQLAAANSDPTRRHSLYTELLNATFLVPLEPEVADHVEPGEDLLVVERVGERPVVAAFTEWDALCRWNPRTWPYRPIRGSELFAVLTELSVAVLEINPRGRTGGQLFAPEIEMLARAARDWKRRHLH